MDLPPLRSFAALARHRHMGQAARALHVCSPTISKHLRHLEQAAACHLVTRTSLGLRLTPAGDLLLARVLPCLAALDAVEAALARLRQRTLGWLDLGMDGEAPAWHCAQILAAIQRRQPDLAFRLRHGRRPEILDAVQTGRFLAGWVLGAVAVAGLDALRLPDLPMRICGPIARRSWLTTATLADLAAEPWIDHDPDGALARHLRAVFAEHPYRIIGHIEAAEALAEFINPCGACCLLPEEAAQAGAVRGVWALWPGHIPPLPRALVTRSGPSDDPLRIAFDHAVADAWLRPEQP